MASVEMTILSTHHLTIFCIISICRTINHYELLLWGKLTLVQVETMETRPWFSWLKEWTHAYWDLSWYIMQRILLVLWLNISIKRRMAIQKTIQFLFLWGYQLVKVTLLTYRYCSVLCMHCNVQFCSVSCVWEYDFFNWQVFMI